MARTAKRTPLADLPPVITWSVVILLMLALVPPVVIWRARTIRTPRRRIHIIQNMDHQPRFRAQQPNELFADGRSMRPPVEGTVALGERPEDTHYHLGVLGGDWAMDFPEGIPVTRRLVTQGRERFGIYCQPCHGPAGYGDGTVHRRAMELIEAATPGGTTWVAPKSLHETAIREQPVGQIFNTVTNGIRNMAGYAAQIPVEDRWAIVAWVQVMQQSQHADPSHLEDPEALPVHDLVPALEDES